jgi:hypothetical protein
MDAESVVSAAVKEILVKAGDRRSILVFCAGIPHAEHVAAEIEKARDGLVATVFGDAAPDQRAWALQAFKDRTVRFLVNVDVLTTGFDAPNVDCVALLRPTLSPGLYCQMVGRGFRLAPNKKNCLVLDFGGNVIRHGPIGVISPVEGAGSGKSGASAVKARECPGCGEMIALRHRTCPACGVTIGEIPDIVKDGWDYLWVEYEEAVESEKLLKKPKYDYVARVIERKPFANLKIGTSFANLYLSTHAFTHPLESAGFGVT